MRAIKHFWRDGDILYYKIVIVVEDEVLSCSEAILQKDILKGVISNTDVIWEKLIARAMESLKNRLFKGALDV